ncbi:phage regulatory protein [Weissella paramesenteroides]|uniref:Rha family transcriptional regulator n=1 Tax=Weissella paramesenteroides TaxID=1249 RepID=UPI002402D77C|nr:Rha family transcriptional regulator [Weissella paramesenteroides]MDF8367235.1 phage regulatory protein [Weissella paramesenteroides]
MTQTEQLVELQNGVATTTSLQVADVFEKNHRDVLETIKNLTAENSAVKNMFKEMTYVNSRGREYPMYQMDKDGFTLLVMGYTGQKATEFKLRYIQAFNEMEQALKNQSALRLPENNAEMVQVIQNVNKETNRRIDEVETTVDELKDRFGLPASQAKSLEQARKRHIVTLLGGFESNAYQHLSGKTFRQIGGDFKDYFEVPRYDALPLSKFDEGMSYIKAWQLPTNLALQVRDLNLQTELEV